MSLARSIVTGMATAGLLACSAADPDETQAAPESDLTLSSTSTPRILSAYVGAVNLGVIPFCPTRNGNVEGMPVVFDRQIQQRGLDAGDFLITSSDGSVRAPECATLVPADEENEDNTVLLVGDFLASSDVTVTRVEVVAPLFAEGPSPTRNGESLVGVFTEEISPVTVSVHLVDAVVPLYEDSEIGEPNGCPSESAAVVRATWSGGIRVVSGVSAIAQVSVLDATGEELTVLGVAPAEEGDGDNILDVCLASSAQPATITVLQGTYTAPNGLPNETTTALIRASSD